MDEREGAGDANARGLHPDDEWLTLDEAVRTFPPQALRVALKEAEARLALCPPPQGPRNLLADYSRHPHVVAANARDRAFKSVVAEFQRMLEAGELIARGLDPNSFDWREFPPDAWSVLRLLRGNRIGSGQHGDTRIWHRARVRWNVPIDVEAPAPAPADPEPEPAETPLPDVELLPEPSRSTEADTIRRLTKRLVAEAPLRPEWRKSDWFARAKVHAPWLAQNRFDESIAHELLTATGKSQWKRGPKRTALSKPNSGNNSRN